MKKKKDSANSRITFQLPKSTIQLSLYNCPYQQAVPDCPAANIIMLLTLNGGNAFLSFFGYWFWMMKSFIDIF